MKVIVKSEQQRPGIIRLRHGLLVRAPVNTMPKAFRVYLNRYSSPLMQHYDEKRLEAKRRAARTGSRLPKGAR